MQHSNINNYKVEGSQYSRMKFFQFTHTPTLTLQNNRWSRQFPTNTNLNISLTPKRSLLKKQIKNLNKKIKFNKYKSQQRKIIGDMINLANNIQCSRKLKPCPTVDRKLRMYKLLHEQQTQMMNIVEKLQIRPISNKLPPLIPSPKASFLKSEAPNQIYHRFKTNPKDFPKLLKEIDIHYQEQKPIQFQSYQCKIPTLKKRTNKRGLKRFRIVGLAIAFGSFFRKDIIQRIEKRKQIHLGVLQDTFSVYTEVIEAYIRGIIRSLTYSLINNAEVDFDLAGKTYGRNNRRSAMKLMIIIRSILSAIYEDIIQENISTGILNFLARVFSENAIFFKNYLSPFEISRLEFNQKQQIVNLSISQKRMLYSMFILSRILVKKILLEQVKDSLKNPRSMRQYIERNLITVASIIQYLIVTSFARVKTMQEHWDRNKSQLENFKAKENLSEVTFIQWNQTGFEQELIPISEFIGFKENFDAFYDNMRILIFDLSESLVNLAESQKITFSISFKSHFNYIYLVLYQIIQILLCYLIILRKNEFIQVQYCILDVLDYIILFKK